MITKEKLIKTFSENYNFIGKSIVLGKAKFEGKIVDEIKINIPLKSFNRHGLISGATGTGKTKTLQIIAEGLSQNGVPTLLMDIKGDLSGIAKPGVRNKHLEKRHSELGIQYIEEGFPVELLSLSHEKGVKLRSTVTEFGYILFSRILNLNQTQEGVMGVIFKFCDDKKLPIIDLQDLKKVLQYISENGKKEFEINYGRVSTASIGAILRKIIVLEQQEADIFFGEPSFDVDDLMKDSETKGKINIIRLTDIQNKPDLFSTFILSLLSEVYETLPEVGDLDKPKLVMFIDEAHLIFKNAGKELLSKIETTVKLIRSKGVGIFFCTQVPGDVPDEILSQLGLKIQHALRGFTAKDRKEIEKAVKNYPLSQYYKAEDLIQNLGIGEAFITALDEKGVPTPLAHTFLVAPRSRMDILSEQEIDDIISASSLVKKYNTTIDKESAFEILSKKIDQSTDIEYTETEKTYPKQEETSFEKILRSPVVRSIGTTIANIVTRHILGSLTKKKRK